MFLKKRSSTGSTSSRSLLHHRPTKFKVQRVAVMSGLSLLQKKFQRPSQKRRAYGKHADEALKRSSLGPRRRMDGMAKLLARAGRGLTYKLPSTNTDEESGTDEDDDKAPNEDRPFEPLCVWQSPHTHTDVEPKGLPGQVQTISKHDDCGIEHTVQRLCPAPQSAYSQQDVFVPSILAQWLRPHQREGVKFLYECVMGLKEFEGKGCILADDMGLGKTLQSVTLIYTLLKTHITRKAEPTAKRVIVVCPCSLVKNWEKEFEKWLGKGGVKTMALTESDRKTVEKNIDTFVRTNMFQILIASYETIRTHVGRLLKAPRGTACCDLLVCDEAHRLKNAEAKTTKALNEIPCPRRVLLTGTPMQNDLHEFFAMVDFINPGVLGTADEFRKRMLFPILRGREPDATERERTKMMEVQNQMSQTVNDFILRRVNTLNAQHLPPKLVQVVCCNLTDVQQNMYQHLVNSKDLQHVMEGKQVNCLSSIQCLMKLCNHPSLIVEDETSGPMARSSKRASTKNAVKKYTDNDKEPSTAAPGADGVAKYMPQATPGPFGFPAVHPEWSGKMYVLYRLMKEMRKPGNGGDKIVIVSNYTQTLDLIGRMCKEESWGFCRLDGSIGMKKRQAMVDEFNDPSSSLIAFLLSSKAGGCGLNLIGGNRLVLFDPDWNPAVDKQAAARCWRDGQTKRCFTYRFMATGTVEEKIFQRQLSKEGLQSVVDDKEQVNSLSTKDLRNLFKLRQGTPSDTHDKLRCDRCTIIHDNAELEAQKVLPKKLEECQKLLAVMEEKDEAKPFQQPFDPTQYGCTKEKYESIVKQPMDFGTIRATLLKNPDQPGGFKSVSEFSKAVNRVFANVLKVWDEGDNIAELARTLQNWWIIHWGELVPKLMTMKADDDENNKDSTAASSCGNHDDDPLAGCASFQNERDDDFQPQLGMPDEENMRSWSHHYSTDSVDDPIFRAAMRGCDAVSFVFGLEVTWSKIQERQQEEEERQREAEELAAMEAMEQCQDDEDDSSDSDDDCKPAAKASPRSSTDKENEGGNHAQAEDTGSNTTIDILDTDNEEEGNDEEPASTPSKQPESLKVESSEDDETPVNKPSAKKAKLDILADSSDEETMTTSLAPDEKETANEKEEDEEEYEEVDGNNEWSHWGCGMCTLRNPKSSKKCTVCGANRKRNAKKYNMKKRSIVEISRT